MSEDLQTKTTDNDKRVVAPTGPETQSLPIISILRQRPRGCPYIIVILAAFLILSVFLGTYFTVRKEYGYSMGDAFTLAGYVIAVGAFLSTGVLAHHYPRCKCWVVVDDVELDSLIPGLG